METSWQLVSCNCRSSRLIASNQGKVLFPNLQISPQAEIKIARFFIWNQTRSLLLSSMNWKMSSCTNQNRATCDDDSNLLIHIGLGEVDFICKRTESITEHFTIFLTASAAWMWLNLELDSVLYCFVNINFVINLTVSRENLHRFQRN